MIRNILLVAMWAAVAMALYSCGKPDIRKSGAAAARGEPVVTRRPDSALGRSEGWPAEPAGLLAVVAQEPGLDQELLAREAIQLELDRDAQVVQAIEYARLRILAQAYIERTVNTAAQASPQEIRKFYEQNPALFAQRRTYRVLELTMDVPQGQFGALQDAVAKAKNIDGVLRWLDSRRLPVEAATPSVAAERIPANTLRRLFGMREGQIAVFQTPRGASVVRLDQSTEAPLTEKQAAPAIARYLLNRKRLELAQAEVAKLRERAQTGDEGMKRTRPATMARNATGVAALK
jgi:EpsD family peptidyl-prolyl cis-trans isomerase